MKFGINLLSQHPADRPQHDMYREMLEQAVLAEELGFDGLFVNEHHPFDRTDELWMQPLPALAGIATRTRRIELGTNVLILPLYHPIQLAEEVAMIHSMSGGRMILGVGIGYKAEEFNAFGLDIKKRVGRFVEQLEIIRRLWRESGVSFSGRHFRFENVSLPIHTFPERSPPLWIGAEIERSISRAGRLGDGWLPADTCSIPLLREYYQVYREGLAESGRRFEDLERPLMRETFVDEDVERGKAIFSPGVLRKYQQYWRTGAPQLRGEFAKEQFGFDELAQDRFIFGHPDECIEQIERHVRELGITYMIFRIQKQGIPHRRVLEVIERLGTKVIPRCR